MVWREDVGEVEEPGRGVPGQWWLSIWESDGLNRMKEDRSESDGWLRRPEISGQLELFDGAFHLEVFCGKWCLSFSRIILSSDIFVPLG
ncbi:hypothetical protein RUM43_012571 [Polyplax serrata]|uniref:Uncharacterized protein n=1 Tax=Polyplax serrata TaxID=468196 RepID=A0AAN8S3Z0_POLSC